MRIYVLVFAAAFASLIFFGCAPSDGEQVVASVQAPAHTYGTPTPLPANANAAELNFRKDWQADFERSKAELIRRRKFWSEKKIADYDFIVAKYAGGFTNTWNRSPVRIKVREGIPKSMEVADKSDISLLARTDGFEDFDTIGKLFDYLLAQLEDGKIVGVNYESRLGYPKRATVTFTYVSNHNYRNIVVSELTPVQTNKTR